MNNRFHAWAFQNFPFMEETFKEIDNYHLMMQILHYLKEQLKDYRELVLKVEQLENWFKNLDVQEEINNKLDEMVESGELQELLSEQYDALRNEVNVSISVLNDNINNFEESTNQEIENFESTVENNIQQFKDSVDSQIDVMNDKIDAVESITPLVATSTAGMTDTSKIYVNTSDGKWYFYDGDSWEIGGTYQSSGVADGTIDVLKLAPNIQANYNLQFSEDLSKGEGFQGYCHGSIGSPIIKETSSASYKYSVINLEVNQVYEFNGFNSWNVYALVVTDSSDNVVYIAPGYGTADNSTSCLFKANTSGLKAYISEILYDVSAGSNNYQKFSSSNRLRKLNGIYNNLLINTTVQLVDTISNKGLTNIATNTAVNLGSYNNYTTYVYSMEPGKHYKVVSQQNYLVQGFIITGNKYNVLYSSYTGQNEKVAVSYEWTAQSNGFIFITKYNNDDPDLYSIGQTFEALDVSVDYYKKLKNKTIVYIGDSITESRTNESLNNYNGGAYPKIIADLSGGEYLNYSGGGATLSYASGQETRSIANYLTNMSTSGDMYVFSGGINDLWDNRPLGRLSDDFTSEVDQTTVIGALEKIFRYALTNFLGKPIMFVITHKVANPYYTNTEHYDQFNLHDAIVSVCKKYSIPYYDAFDCSGLNGWNDAQKTAYLNSNPSGTPDGTHPNKTGYEKYYVPEIVSIMDSLL